VKGFSQKLKEVASVLTGIPPSFFESQQFKQRHLPGWDMTARELLQKLGTEAIRNGLHQDAWVNALFSEYKDHDNWIIVDCRFPNEAQRVLDYGGLIVRIDRYGVGPLNDHPSETSLDEWDFDIFIKNNGDINQLKETVKEILKLRL
jgi:hypothetical protein